MGRDRADAVHDQVVAQSEEDDGVPRLRSVRAVVDVARRRGCGGVPDRVAGRGCGACGSARSSRSSGAMSIWPRGNCCRSDPTGTGHVTVPKGGRSRQLPLTQRLTAALKRASASAIRAGVVSGGWLADHARSVIKAIRGRQRVAGIDAGRAHPAAHVLFAPGDEGRAGAGHPGAGRTRGPVDDAALHAPESGGNGRRDPVARRTTVRRRTRGKFWRYFGHARAAATEVDLLREAV